MKDIDPALYKLPPQNIEAEQSILGSILLENGSINAALEIINKGDFYNEAHRKIFSVIVELSDKNEPVDLITLEQCAQRQEYAGFGRRHRLSGIIG